MRKSMNTTFATTLMWLTVKGGENAVKKESM